MSGKVYAGNLRIAVVSALGVALGGYIGLLNTVKLELQTPAPDNVDQISKGIGSVGQLKSRAQIPKPTTLAISIDDLDDQRILAYALNGVVTNYNQAAALIKTQASATVTAEAVSAGVIGSVIQLANTHVSAVVVKDSTDTTTFVLGDDYTVDALNGTITTVVGGDITTDEALHVGYTAATVAAESVTAPLVAGDWFPLANRHVSAVVVKNSGESTTYTAGTDYLVDAVPGFIKVLAGGAITAGQSLKVSYKAAAISGKTVQGSTVPSTLLRVVVQLEDLVDNSEAYFICPIFQASSSGNQDLFGKNMLVAGLQGAMFLPPEGTAANTETGGAPYIITSIAA